MTGYSSADCIHIAQAFCAQANTIVREKYLPNNQQWSAGSRSARACAIKIVQRDRVVVSRVLQQPRAREMALHQRRLPAV